MKPTYLKMNNGMNPRYFKVANPKEQFPGILVEIDKNLEMIQNSINKMQIDINFMNVLLEHMIFKIEKKEMDLTQEISNLLKSIYEKNCKIEKDQTIKNFTDEMNNTIKKIIIIESECKNILN